MDLSEMIPVGEHQTILLDQFVPFLLSRPYPNAWHLMIQTDREIWFRCDGAIPAEGSGFRLGKSDGIQILPVCNDNFLIMSPFPDTRVQVRWMGINGSLV